MGNLRVHSIICWHNFRASVFRKAEKKVRDKEWHLQNIRLGRGVHPLTKESIREKRLKETAQR